MRLHRALHLSLALLSGMLHAQAPLPDAPSALPKPAKTRPAPCPVNVPYSTTEAVSAQQARSPCLGSQDPYQRFLDSETPIPLSPRQKGYLAFRDVVDPFNLLTITGNSAVTIAADSHSAYGPGMRGFGKNVGVSFLQDATGEFIGTFGVCSLFHQDPHYHRLPTATPTHRLLHAIRRTVVAQSDDGHLIPNYENLITYPASAEISNLYVPGIHGNAPSTIARILTGLATDPISNIITEFLPDFARRVHIRIVFVQQILNQIASGQEL